MRVPPVRPWSTRNRIMLSIFQARPHRRLVTVNKTIEMVNSTRVESACDNHAVSGMMITSAVR